MNEALLAIECMGPLGSFPWHTQQQFALASATNVVVVLGGNQSGKSTAGAGVVSRLVRREGPIYRRLRNPENRPLKIWVSPQSFEKYKSNWEMRLHDDVFDGMDVTHGIEMGYKQTPVPVFTWDDSCAGGNSLYGKSQDQGFLAFESDVVDLIVFDEEPKDPRLYTSAVQRLATTNGIILLTFTPLLGISWTFGRFYQPCARDDYKVADRVWRRGNDITVIGMGMADNPEAVAGGGVARIQNDPGMTEAEKNTRLYGKYGYAEGLIFPGFATLNADDADNPFIIDGLPPDRQYSWMLTCDPNKRHGGLLTAIDHEGNRFYTAEHYKEDQPDRLHASDYHEILKRFRLEDKAGVVSPSLGIYADPGGAGAQAIINMSDYGIFAGAVKKDAGSVKASIELIRRAAWIDPTHRHPVTGVLGASHTYFLRTLKSTWTVGGVEYHESRLMWELRQYRQKDTSPPDTPIKELDDVVDPMRYLELVRPFAPVHVDRTEQVRRASLDRLSRKASVEFDELAKKANQPAAVRGDTW
jgi:phage terminase large subunit-like protein